MPNEGPNTLADPDLESDSVDSLESLAQFMHCCGYLTGC